MDTKRPNVSSRFAADPEDTKVTVIVELNKFALVDSPDTQLSLDSRNQRGPLEQGTRQRLEGLGKGCLAARDSVMEANDCHVFFAGSLLRLDETSCAVDADNETASDLGIEGTTVTSLFTSATFALASKYSRRFGSEELGRTEESA